MCEDWCEIVAEEAPFSAGLALTWFAPVAEIVVAPLQAIEYTQRKGGVWPNRTSSRGWDSWSFSGKQLSGNRYLYAIADVGLDKIGPSTNFCPVPLILAVGPTPPIGGTPNPN